MWKLLLWYTEIDVQPDDFSLESTQQSVNHVTIYHPFSYLLSAIKRTFFMLLDSSRVIRDVKILM